MNNQLLKLLNIRFKWFICIFEPLNMCLYAKKKWNFIIFYTTSSTPLHDKVHFLFIDNISSSKTFYYPLITKLFRVAAAVSSYKWPRYGAVPFTISMGYRRWAISYDCTLSPGPFPLRAIFAHQRFCMFLFQNEFRIMKIFFSHFLKIFLTNIFFSQFGLFPIKDMQIHPLLQKWPYLNEKCSLCWSVWKINFPIFIFWVMFDCIYNLQVTPNFPVCRRPK